MEVTSNPNVIQPSQIIVGDPGVVYYTEPVADDPSKRLFGVLGVPYRSLALARSYDAGATDGSDDHFTGTVNVTSGGAVTWVSGHKFETEWQDASQFNLTGTICLLSGSPSSTTACQLLNGDGSAYSGGAHTGVVYGFDTIIMNGVFAVSIGPPQLEIYKNGDRSRVGLLAVGERNLGSKPIVAFNALVQFYTAGTAEALEINVNNRYADQQLNDGAGYSTINCISGGEHIMDKMLIFGSAPNSPAYSRAVLITNCLDRGLYIGGAFSGVVSTANSGGNTTVTWQAGNKFSTTWRGGAGAPASGLGGIQINNSAREIVSVSSTTAMTVAGNMGTLTNVPYFYGAPQQGIYLDAQGVANSTGTNHFRSNSVRFVTSHYNAGVVYNSFELQSVPTSTTAAKFSLAWNSGEILYIASSGHIETASGITTGDVNVFAGVSSNHLRITPSSDVDANTEVYGTNAANSMVRWSIKQSGAFTGGDLSVTGLTTNSTVISASVPMYSSQDLHTAGLINSDTGFKANGSPGMTNPFNKGTMTGINFVGGLAISTF